MPFNRNDVKIWCLYSRKFHCSCRLLVSRHLGPKRDAFTLTCWATEKSPVARWASQHIWNHNGPPIRQGTKKLQLFNRPRAPLFQLAEISKRAVEYCFKTTGERPWGISRGVKRRAGSQTDNQGDPSSQRGSEKLPNMERVFCATRICFQRQRADNWIVKPLSMYTKRHIQKT